MMFCDWMRNQKMCSGWKTKKYPKEKKNTGLVYVYVCVCVVTSLVAPITCKYSNTKSTTAMAFLIHWPRYKHIFYLASNIQTLLPSMQNTR